MMHYLKSRIDGESQYEDRYIYNLVTSCLQVKKNTAILQNFHQLLTTETRGERLLEEKSIEASFKLIHGGSRVKCVCGSAFQSFGAVEVNDLWPF